MKSCARGLYLRRSLISLLIAFMPGVTLARNLPDSCRQEAFARGLVPPGHQVRVHTQTGGEYPVRIIVEENHRGGEDYRVWMHPCRMSPQGEIILESARNLFPGMRWEDAPPGTFTCLDTLEQKAPLDLWPPARIRVRSGVAPFQEMILLFCDTPHRRGEDYRTYLFGCDPLNRYGDDVLSAPLGLFPKVGSIQ